MGRNTTFMAAALPRKQQGVVLFVSLVILLVLTILGVTAISSTTMEERMAFNHQQSDLTFQAAESGIAQVIDKASSAYPGYSDASNPFYSALNGVAGNTVNAGSYTQSLTHTSVIYRSMTYTSVIYQSMTYILVI